MDLVNWLRLIKGITQGRKKMSHCKFIFRSFFTGKFAGLTSRSYWHGVQMVLLSHHRGRDFFLIFLSLACLKARCPVCEVPAKAPGKNVYFWGEADLTYFRKEYDSGRSGKILCMKFLRRQEANIEELKI